MPQAGSQIENGTPYWGARGFTRTSEHNARLIPRKCRLDLGAIFSFNRGVSPADHVTSLTASGVARLLPTEPQVKHRPFRSVVLKFLPVARHPNNG